MKLLTTITRRAIQALLVLLVLSIAFLLVANNFAASETRIECSGQLKRTLVDGTFTTNLGTLYAQIDRYRWFVFWMDHDAMIVWEIQPGNVGGFGYYREGAVMNLITDLARTTIHGSFSTLSNHIRIETPYDETFDGSCEPRSISMS